MRKEKRLNIGWKSASPSFNKVGLFEYAVHSELTCTASSRINNMLTKANFAKTHAIKVRLDAYGGTWYTYSCNSVLCIDGIRQISHPHTYQV